MIQKISVSPIGLLGYTLRPSKTRPVLSNTYVFGGGVHVQAVYKPRCFLSAVLSSARLMDSVSEGWDSEYLSNTIIAVNWTCTHGADSSQISFLAPRVSTFAGG